jgi:PII-like signaling protein
MKQAQPAKLLRIHIAESDRYAGRPLYEAIVAECRRLGVAGATVLRGLEGYGETAELHRPHVFRRDQPVVILVADTAEKVAALMQALEAMIDTGLMAVSDVEMLRVQRRPSPPVL